jgi:hypothetical protein
MHSSAQIALLVLVVGALTTGPVNAQAPADTVFRPDAVWPGQVDDRNGSDLRSGTGHPGPSYWQNHVQYTINATLDTSSQKIQGTVEAKYTNNSPSPVSSLWFLVSSRSDVGPAATPESRIQIASITVGGASDPYTPSTFRKGSRLQVRLKAPVAARGGTTSVAIKYEMALSENDVPGWTPMRSGPLYGIGHWYPRVAAYTDRYGWASGSSGISRSSFAEYGSFNYSLNVPASFIIAGSGTLMNPSDVLTSDQRRRLLRARDSRQKVAIITPDQAGTEDTRPQQSGTLTWEFQMNGVRDVAWAASPGFIWNAANFSRPGKQDALAMAYYPRSAMGGEAWNRATYHTQKSVSLYSKRYFAYPWNNTTTVTGPGRQAFPGLSFCPPSATGKSLFSCVARNQSASWFPGIVASNPNRNPWLSEGLQTFLSTEAHRRLYDGEFYSEQYTGDTETPTTTSAITQQLKKQNHRSILAAPSPSTPATAFTRSVKPAYGLELLRSYVLDADLFDYSLRQFIQRWAYRVSTPSDFFQSIEDATGTELSWFWTGWFGSTWQLDLAVASVSYPNKTPEKGSQVQFTLQQKLPMPVRAKVVEVDGDTLDLHLPVEIWREGPSYTVPLNTDSPLKTVTIDPSRTLPDANYANNTWTSPNL